MSGTAEVKKLQAAQKSVAIAQHAVSTALLEARKKHGGKAKKTATKSRKGSRKGGKRSH